MEAFPDLEEYLRYTSSLVGNPTAIELKAVEVRLSDEHFLESLKKIKGKTGNEGVEQLEVWPSSKTMAELALAVYEDDGGLSSALLQAGWEVLTTASSPHSLDGYFGAAYLNRDQQQLVLAHRGTKNLSSWNTNIKSIVNNAITSRMNSAITFSGNIIAALKECEDSRIRFQLSMTGHSLGGWLAQVATFFSEYLEWNEEGITELKTGRGGYHVRTVAFESPGCELMLNKLVKDLDLRYKVTMDLGRLDITSFLTAPNRVNTINVHVGEVFKIDIDLTTMTFFHKYTFQYNMFTHSMEKIAEAFRENKKVSRVLDWPRAGVLHTRAEYGAFHSRATRGNEYNPPTAARPSWDHYSTEEVSDDSCSLRVFSDRELALLEVFVALEKSKLDLVKIDNFLGEIGLEVSINKLFGDTTYNYKEGTLKCPSPDQVVKFVKILLRWWGDEAEKAAQEQMKLVPSAGEAMWLQESRRVLDSFPKLFLGLEDVIGLKPFLEAPDRKVLVLEVADTAFEFYRVHCLLQQMDSQESKLFLEWKQFEDLQKYTDFEVLTTSEAADNRILVLNYNKQTAEVNKLLEELLASYGVTKSARKKLILVSKGESDLKFSDLTTEARESIVTRTFILVKDKPTTPTSIRDMLGSGGVSEEAINDLLDGPTLKALVMNDELKVHLDGYWPDFQAMDATHTTVNTEINMGELKGFLRKQSRPYLVVSGLSQDDRQSSEWSEIFKLMAEDVNDTEQEEEAGAALFRQACQNQENKTVVWVQLAVGKLWLKRVYDLNLYVKRTFVNKIEIDFKELVKLDFTKLDPIYVFQNIENGNTRKDFSNSIKDLSNDLAKRCVFLGSGEQYNEPAHFLEIEEVGTEKERVVWKSSTMSLDGLRPAASYSTAPQDAIGEQQLSAVLMQRKLVLLVGEPGMGKSTLLTAVPRYILNSWLVRIDLRHYQAKIRNLTPHLNYQDVVKFLLPEQSESFQLKLFQYVLKSEASYRACILFDGFDEIQEEYSGQVIEKSAMGKTVALLKFLMDKTSANVVVTTRSYPYEFLENELSTFATKFNPIDQEQQRQFSQEFWRLRLAGGLEEGLLRRCSEALCNLGGTFAGLMGVPLQMRMLTEGFLPHVRRLGASPPTDPEQSLADVFRCGSTHGLYELFIQSKIDIYLREKLNLSPIPLMKWIENGISEKHQKLGFIQLFPNLRFQQKELIELSKVGLFQLGADWTCDFIHPTFAEYFAAAYFEGGSLLKAEVELLMTVVLLEERFKVVRMFLNGHLRKHRENWTNGPEKRIFSDIKELWSDKRVRHKFFTKYQQTALHVAVQEQNESIVRFLLMVLQSENTSKEGRGISEFVDFVASRDRGDRTALHLACDRGDAVCVGAFIAGLEACALQDKRYVLYSFFYGYTGNITNLDDILKFITKNEKELTKSHGVTQKLNKDFLELLDRLEVQVPAYFREIISNKNDKLQAIKDFLEAADSGNDKYIKQRLRNIKDEVVKRNLLRALNYLGYSGLHLAAKGGCLPTVRVLLQHGAPPDILNSLGLTPLMSIAYGNPKSQIKIAEELIKSGAYPDHRDMDGMSAVSHCTRLALLNYLIDECKADWKMPDYRRQSPLHHAAMRGSPKVVKRLLELGAPIDEQDESESTALVLTIKNCQTYYWMRPDDLRMIELLVAKGANVNIRDSQGNSPLRLAIQTAVENEIYCAFKRTKPASFYRETMHILEKNGAEH